MFVFTKNRIIDLRFVLLVISFSFGFGQGFLQTSNTSIVDGNGNKVVLRGVALGGWLVPEGYMFQIPGSGSPTTIREKIVSLVGEESTNEFYEKFEKNYVQEQDIKAIADWGFNSIRLPLHYKNFSPSKGEYIEKGFTIIDSLVSWCKKYKLYLILDMHAAPGGQSPGEIADAHGVAELWTKKENQDHLIEIWGEIAKQYSNEKTIGGYDLINEPVLPNNMGNKENRNLHLRIRNQIRKYDQNHIIFVNGNWYSTSFGGLTPAFDNNMVWAFHKYWNDVTIGTIQYLINLSNETNTPLWLGEFGENSNEWWARVIDLVESKGIGWNWWTYKKYDTITTIASVPLTKNYRRILDYWDGKTPKPSQDICVSGLMEMAEGLLLKNCEIRRGVISSLLEKSYRKESRPFKNHVIPGEIAFADYDLGALGISYMDYDYMRIGVGDQTSHGNSGWSYRNDGVDIESSNDTTIIPYSVGWTQAGEFMNYTVNVLKSGDYTFSIRSASSANQGAIVIYSGQEKIIDAVDLPVTGGNQIWINTEIGEAYLSKGLQTLKILIGRPKVNLKLLKIESNEAKNGLISFNHQIYPNPMSNQLKIEYESLFNTQINVAIYNINGQEIWATERRSRPGENQFIWLGTSSKGRQVSSGIYFLTLDDGNKTIQEKITIIR